MGVTEEGRPENENYEQKMQCLYHETCEAHTIRLKKNVSPRRQMNHEQPMITFKMFKRPIPRARVPTTDLVSRVNWAPGRVGDIITGMRQMRVPAPPPREWTPPYDAEFYARHTENPEAFLARVEAWYAAHPKAAVAAPVAKPELNLEPLCKLFAKYSDARPPIEEHVRALRQAGYPEERIEKLERHHQWLLDTVDERQEKLDAIFVKWPSINKAAAKPKPAKPIKAVKKKIVPK